MHQHYVYGFIDSGKVSIKNNIVTISDKLSIFNSIPFINSLKMLFTCKFIGAFLVTIVDFLIVKSLKLIFAFVIISEESKSYMFFLYVLLFCLCVYLSVISLNLVIFTINRRFLLKKKYTLLSVVYAKNTIDAIEIATNSSPDISFTA